MKKIMIISYYELKDYFLNIKESFEYYHYSVCSYPLFQYAYDVHDKIQNYKEHMNKFIKEMKPDIILWWFIDVPVDVFEYIKTSNKNIYYIIFNNDDALNMGTDTLKKCENVNMVITNTKENIIRYKLYSKVNNINYGLFGYDPKYIYPISEEMYKDHIDDSDNIYKCDISIICHNLLLDSNYYNAQYINRIEMIDNIIEYSKKNNRIFKIFGSPIIKEYYPEYYYGEIQYLKINKLHNLSKININTHMFYTKSMYLNEHTMSIMGAGGLLMIDNVKDIQKILTHNINCIIMDKNKYIDQIDDILKNYEAYSNIKMNAHKFAEDYTWKNWVKNIHIAISETYFDADAYNKINDLKIENPIFDDWKCNGLNNNMICYNIDVPSSFRIKDYINNNSLKDKDDKYVYFHWYTHGKEEKYICDKKENSIDFTNCGITSNKFFEFGYICNMIQTPTTKDDGLDKLYDFCKYHPYIDIQKLLDNYYNII